MKDVNLIFRIEYEHDKDEISLLEIPINQLQTDAKSNTDSNELKSNSFDEHSSKEFECQYELNSTSQSLSNIREKLEQNHNDSTSQNEPDDILGNKSLLKQVLKKKREKKKRIFFVLRQLYQVRLIHGRLEMY